MDKPLLSIRMLVLLGVFVLATTACGIKLPNPPHQEKDPIVLRIAWYGPQSRHDATLRALEAYTKLNPHITFEPETANVERYPDMLSARFSSGNEPDLFAMDNFWLAEYAGRHQLADLSEGIRIDSIEESLVQDGMYQGKLYGIPTGTTAIGMIYNKKMVDQIGITPPRNGWTWEEYMQFGQEAAKQLGPDRYAMNDETIEYTVYTAYQASHGKGDAVTIDGQFNFDRETWLHYMNMYAELRSLGVVPPPEISVTEKDVDAQLDLVMNGTSLLRRGFSSTFVGYDHLKPDTFELVTLPGAAEASGHLKASGFWSVSPNTPYLEEAKAFIDWFIHDEEATLILGTVRGMPVTQEMLDILSPLFTEAEKKGAELVRNVAHNAQAFTVKAEGWSTFYQKDYEEIVQKVMFGKITAEEGFEQLRQKAKEYE